jgi:hypothetical protein
MQEVNEAITGRRPKTVKVPADIYKAFKAYVHSFRYRVECVEQSKMHDETIKKVLRDKTCSPDTLVRIKEIVNIKTGADECAVSE